MARPRQPADWERDRAAAVAIEREVHNALKANRSVSQLSDFTEEMDTLDFRFRFEGEDVQVDAKAKFSRYSDEIAAQWPEVPRDELLVIDETSFRELIWQTGLGYLVVNDVPRTRWHVLGPWELCLGPRRRFERRGTRTGTEFLKGKLLLDLRTAADSSPSLDVEVLLRVIQRSRASLRQVRAVAVPSEDELPVVPARTAATPTSSVTRVVPPTPTDDEPEPDATWAGLSASLVERVRSAWGWDRPTQIQTAAFPVILRGWSALLVAPTAGGKTEAALLPLLDRYKTHRWSTAKPSILVVSPLKALLDDQLERWRAGCELVGATAFAWHGDVDAQAKREFKDRRADVLMTTPESLELLLTSSSHDERAMFTALRAVVIDEVHAFVGTARGAQLSALLERLFRFTDSDFQRIGLSATIAAPDSALTWLNGGSLLEKEIVTAAPRMRGEDVSILTYEDETHAASQVGAAAASGRALIFTRSRRRAEQLGHSLGVPVHHSSISAEDRADAVARLRRGDARCIVATGSLEMGIDIGDLDLVVHDGPPTSPDSYLQRVGRSGRKTGQRRVIFTLGATDDLVMTLAVIARARRGDLERRDPQQGARLVLGQQAIAIALQEFITDRDELFDTLRWSPTFAGLDADIAATIDHLLAAEYLRADGARLVLGRLGNEQFGGRQGVLSLLATFSAVSGLTVCDEAGRKIGTIDWSQIDEGDSPRPTGLVLSGRAWTVVSVVRSDALVTVTPGALGRPPSWRGPVLEVERETWEAVREVLEATDVPAELDDRARDWLLTSRKDWSSRLSDPVRQEPDATVVDSFCGARVHRAALHALDVGGDADGITCSLEEDVSGLATKARELLSEFDAVVEREAERLAPQVQVRHHDLLPPAVLLAEVRRFHVDSHGLHRFLSMLAEA